MVFHPPRFIGISVGIIIVLEIMAVAGLLAYRLSQNPISLLSFLMVIAIILLVLVAILFLFWVYGCWSLEYIIDRNSLSIKWAMIKHIVPLYDIKSMISGEKLKHRVGFGGINWFGHHVGNGWVENVGSTLFYSTYLSPKNLLYIITPQTAYAISVADPYQFALEVKMRQELGPLVEVAPSIERNRLLALPLWKDYAALILSAIAFLLNASLFAYICYAYPFLDLRLSQHFTVLVDNYNYLGSVKGDIYGFVVPGVAFSVLVLNLFLGFMLHQRERLASYLCLLASVFIQALFWIATIRIIG